MKISPRGASEESPPPSRDNDVRERKHFAEGAPHRIEERTLEMPVGQPQSYGNFESEMQTNFMQPDGMSYYGLTRQGGPPSRSLNEGIDSLFQDYKGGSQGPLEFDFGDDLLPEDSLLSSQQANWHRQAVLSNLAAQGVGIQSLGPPNGPARPIQWGNDTHTGQSGPVFEGWSINENSRMDMEQSPPESPNVPFQLDPSSASAGTLGESLEDNFPKMEVAASRSAKASARQAAQQERDRERAEKLKEKNKRAQRKFRQRQKDRQETAEKMASDLAEELKALQVQKDALEVRNKQLEAALNISTQNSSSPSTRGERPSEDSEPTFTPAKGWTEFHPHGGMVLLAICQPPRRLTHKQIMSLSLRDVSKIMNELVLRLRDCLAAVENPETSSTAEARIKALLTERHALMAYLAVNNPTTVYKVLSTKMTDPPEQGAPPPGMWQRVLSSMQMSETQKANMMEARELYIKKMGELLLERQALRVKLQDMDLIPAPSEISRIPMWHLAWNEVAEGLKINLEMSHRCHAYYMSRIWYHDCFTPLQVSRFLVEAHPYPIDIFTIIRIIADQMGEKTYMEILEGVLGKEEIDKTSIPLDLYMENWPENLVGKTCAEGFRKGSDENESTATSLPDLANSIVFLPDLEAARQKGSKLGARS